MGCFQAVTLLPLHVIMMIRMGTHLQQLPAERVPQLNGAVLTANSRHSAVCCCCTADDWSGLPLHEAAALYRQHVRHGRLRFRLLRIGVGRLLLPALAATG